MCYGMTKQSINQSINQCLISCGALRYDDWEKYPDRRPKPRVPPIIEGGGPFATTRMSLPVYQFRHELLRGRGLHSSTSQLNSSAFYGIGGARRGCVARVKGALGGVYGV
jgi:hypothetical protein